MVYKKEEEKEKEEEEKGRGNERGKRRRRSHLSPELNFTIYSRRVGITSFLKSCL